MVVILILGFLLRAYNLGKESLWFDEGGSLNWALLDLQQILFQGEENPPLYYIVLHFWVNLFGTSEISLRFPSLMFGTASIWFVYVIGNELFNRNTGMLAALMLSLNSYHIYYSQEARTYALSVFLTLLSMYCFINLTRRKHHLSSIGYVIFSSLLLYSHVYGMFIVFAQNLYVLTKIKAYNKAKWLYKWVWLQLCILLIFSPWLHVLLAETVDVVKQGFWIPAPGLHTLISTFSTVSGSRYLFLLYGIILLSSFIWHCINRRLFSMKGFFISDIQDQEKASNHPSGLYLMALWLFIPIAIPFIISKLSTPIFHSRYVIVSSTGFYLIVALTIVNLKISNYLRVTVVMLIVLISAGTLSIYYSSIKKEPWRDVAALIDSEARQGDIVLFNSGNCRDYVFNYYSRGRQFEKIKFPETTRIVKQTDMQRLKDVINGSKRIWLLLSHQGNNANLINKELAKTYVLKRKLEYSGIRLFLYEPSIGGWGYPLRSS